jgi:hypothetical protein
MDELYDPNEFLITFPLWFWVHPNQNVAMPFIEVGGPGGERAAPFFTDKDLAERFRGPPLAHYSLAMIEGPLDLLEVLSMLEAKGLTHVTIDQTERGAMYYAIRDLRSRALD